MNANGSQGRTGRRARRRTTARARLHLVLLLVVVGTFVAGGTPARAGFPGAEGTISFEFWDQEDDAREIGSLSPEGLKNLSNSTADDVDPAWSPDGWRLAFASDRDGFNEYEIYVMNADGSGQLRLTSNSARDKHPTWSPDGERLAFVSNRDGNDEIYIMDADGTDQTRLTYSAHSDWYPSWSPDGEKIAAVWGYPEGPGNSWTLYTLSIDGTGYAPIESGVSAAGIDWSPDGTKIAFSDDGPGPGQAIWSVGASGGLRTLLTEDDPDDATDPAWSPHGDKLAYVVYRGPGLGWEIHVVDLDDGSWVQVANGLDPTWQPMFSFLNCTVVKVGQTAAPGPVPPVDPPSRGPLAPVFAAVSDAQDRIQDTQDRVYPVILPKIADFYAELHPVAGRGSGATISLIYLVC